MILFESDLPYIYIYIYIKGRETLRRITGDHRRVGCIGILNAKSVRKKKKKTIYARRLRTPHKVACWYFHLQFWGRSTSYLLITHFNVDSYPAIDI